MVDAWIGELRGDRQRFHAGDVLVHHSGAFVHEILAHGKRRTLDGAHQRRGTSDGLGVDACAGIDAGLHDIENTAVSGMVKWRPFEVVRLVHIGTRHGQCGEEA